MAQANIAFLLGKEIQKEETDFSEYIEVHMPKNGIFISSVSAYEKESEYDFVMKASEIMKRNLNDINMTYQVDKENYLIANGNSKNELSANINKVINGDKKVIIGFLPYFYTHINDTNQGTQLWEMMNPYISLKPYNNIHVYICNPNEATPEDFMNMIEEIANIK